jgi:hypothetical protein
MVCTLTQAKYLDRGVAENGVPIVSQRDICSMVERKSTLKTSKGQKTHSRYRIYIPTDVAEDKAFRARLVSHRHRRYLRQSVSGLAE